MFPNKIAIPIATTPFKISQISVSAAAPFPTERSILVLPAFPLPFSLTSNPANFLLMITEKFILPIKYASVSQANAPNITNHIYNLPFSKFSISFKNENITGM